MGGGGGVWASQDQVKVWGLKQCLFFSLKQAVGNPHHTPTQPTPPHPTTHLAGSPVWPLPSLSISSMSTRGLEVPVVLRHCTILPGMAPT